MGARAALRQEQREEGCVLALAGNPNVGKTSVFNRLTGSRQHTGNWAGKTVVNARGSFRGARRRYTVVDVPGTCSLLARSAEEEVARDLICFGGAEGTILVCDACDLQRSMSLLLQILEVTDRVLLCVNLMDEAEKKGIRLDLPLLSRRLGLPVVGVSARRRGSRETLLRAIDAWMDAPVRPAAPTPCPEPLESAIGRLLPLAEQAAAGRLPARWLSLRLLEGDESLLRRTDAYLSGALSRGEALCREAASCRETLGLDRDQLGDLLAAALDRRGRALCEGVISGPTSGYGARDLRLDCLVTGRALGIPLLLCLLALVFYLTIAGAEPLSQLLSRGFARAEERLAALLLALRAPPWLQSLLAEGAFRVLAWVVSVMLPPMAIFFPLFTLLEDLGYLPRVAFTLDRPFRRCGACGKMGLTMCMGFGCNAAGVVGCRIIDSERERLLAILTNSLVPCNGRFPLLITLLALFFSGGAGGSTWRSALELTALVVLSVGLTLLSARLLSATVLRGKASSYVLELPPYRMPQIGSVLLRSVLDRSLFVLGRAAAVAAPAGLLLWCLANLCPGGQSLLARCAQVLDPLGRFLGLDGVIILAFLLGLPANETVLPIILMAYSAQSSLRPPGELAEIRALLLANGWTARTALCVLLFTLLHWPCSTTLLTIRRETGSWRWTALAALLPTALGLTACTLITLLSRAFYQ